MATGKMKVTRAVRRENSRESALVAAVALFAERGYPGVSLNDISAVSGVKRTLMLYHFKTKDELWKAAADDVSKRFNATVQTNVAGITGSNDQELLRKTVSAWLDAFLDCPDFPRFLVREGGLAGPRLQYLVARFEYAPLNYFSPKARQMLRGIMRDALMAIYLSMAALGPLMEASLSRVSGRPKTGIYPMSVRTRAELVGFILNFLSAADTNE
jgi:TetR/AcrR family transcriptional regulator